METRCGCVVKVEEESQVGDARRQFSRLATEIGFDETDAGRVALVATEMAGNLIKHTPGGGRLLAQPRLQGGVLGLDILSLDRGPGIANVGAALRDGFTTAGSPGTGLGAISRLADHFDIHSLNGVGTAILARLWPKGGEPPRALLEIGAVQLSKPRESVCGDNWSIISRPAGAMLLVADGLGHPLPDEATLAVLAYGGDQVRARPPAWLALVERGAALRPLRLDDTGP